MKILLTGDSITDMGRNRDADFNYDSYGYSYPIFIEGELATKFPGEYEIINRGISGNRSVDLYSRIKNDCWNLHPDLISILIGVNDVWHEITYQNGVESDRYKRIYQMFIEDTLKVLPNVKFMLLEPYVLHGSATEDNYDKFLKTKEYAKIVREIADQYHCCFVPLQKKLEELSEKNGQNHYIYDGVHPNVAGAKVISDSWLESFYNFIKR